MQPEEDVVIVIDDASGESCSVKRKDDEKTETPVVKVKSYS